MDWNTQTIDWKSIKEKVKTQSWAAATVEALKEGFDSFISQWPHMPSLERTERFHGYFCKVCASRLLPDLKNPYEHICSGCNTIYTGHPYDGAWRALVHSSIAANMERAAVLANLYPEDKRYSDYVRSVALFYADHYEGYEAPDEQNGQAKVMPHVLNESIFVIHMERILRMVQGLGLFSPQEHNKLGEGFFRPAARFILPTVDAIHNQVAWRGGAIAAAAAFLEDKKLLDFAIDSQFGWYNQIDKGTTEDGIWYEISPNYHFYTMAALISTAQVAKTGGCNLFEYHGFRKMISNITELAYDNGELPAYNDCWYGYELSRYANIYEQLSGIYSETAQALPLIYHNAKPRPCMPMTEMGNASETPATSFVRNSVAALLYGSPEIVAYEEPIKRSRALVKTGIGILENEHIRVGFKATDDCGWHEHFDKLSIDLYAAGNQISADIGTSGYGVARTTLWNKSGAAHNMVIVNGERQTACNARIHYDGGDTISGVCTEAYDGVILKRTLKLEGSRFYDTYEVGSENESVIDWIFHCKGEVIGVYADGKKAELQPTAGFEQGNGYDQISELTKINIDGAWHIGWQTPAGLLKLEVEGEKDTTIFVGSCYGPVGALPDSSIVIIRRRKTQTVFHCRFELQPTAQ